ncbi:transcriptional repressor TraM [Aminobacter sp. MSH1]|uniref:transcriptional repressor TraM n=1 Tax=Aminobacter sp. MSH1 TaxID=374606 RepID=UPI000D3AA6BE|nr:transcriptional repressor TraM [Aminobacter sp. MSH1]
MSDDEKGNVQPEHKLVLRPVVGLTENLPTSDLEQITVQAIRTHRRLRDLAEARQDQWHAIEARDPSAKSARPARIAYVTAMIEMHAQQTVLSTLLDVLGYIPSVPED